MTADWHNETLESYDGIELYGFHVKPENVKALIILVHGYGEHSGVYRKLAQFWCKEGYGTYAYDLRGHGGSGGMAGYVHRFDDYLDDLDLILARLRDREKSVPVFLVGQDIGGIIVGLFALTRKPLISGTVMCGIPFDLPLKARDAQLTKVLSLIHPKWPFGPDKLAHLAFGEDRPNQQNAGFRATRVPVRTIFEIAKASENLLQNGDRLLGPLLIIHGRHDPFGRAVLAQQLHDLTLSYDKTCWIIEDGKHRLLDADHRFSLDEQLIQWFDERYQRSIEDHWSEAAGHPI